jgi:AraC-like DNA-binding protein
MNMQRYLPSDVLRPFVKAFLVIECDTERLNLLLPDTSVVMAFRYKGTVADGQYSQGSNLPFAAISGLRKTSRLIHYAKDAATLLVLFQEGGAAAFLREPLHELFGQSVALDDLMRPHELTSIEERLVEAKTARQRITIVEQFLLSRLAIVGPDKLITQAVGSIKAGNGSVSVRALAESLSISQDAFEKRFRRVVGTTPKQFASLVRFRHLLNNQMPGRSLTELAYESGYYDQAHFIKDFRSFTGQAPHDFFKSSQYW